jgi:DNA (cytosine-5)-methyltransferase 1
MPEGLSPISRFSLVDLFSGCGGMSYGFSRSGLFDVVLANDLKKPALRTFEFNFRNQRRPPSTIDGDLRHIGLSRIQNELSKFGIHGPGELDCLVGGPPCQGFSQMRRSEVRQDGRVVGFSGYDPLHQDPRNDLVLRFLEVAEVLRPKVVLIENVPQILGHAHNGAKGGLRAAIVAALHSMGYDVAHRLLNAADYGVPQLRNRAFFIASNIKEATFPNPTHSDLHGHADLIGLSPWLTVRDAIGDLPKPNLGPDDAFGGQATDVYPSVGLSQFAQAMRSQTAFPFNHVTRNYSSAVLNIIKQMRPGETWDESSLRIRENYAALAARDRLSDEAVEATTARLVKAGVINAAFFRRYYWSAYTRLAWDQPALTITANANFLGSGRFTHPEEDRGLTMREAARLQSFPDDFRFITSAQSDNDTTSIGVGLDMIGEAVPPLMAEALARHIATLLMAGSPSKVREGARI